jgi:hypothetical protein
MRVPNLALGLIMAGLLAFSIIVLVVWPKGAAALILTMAILVDSVAVVWLILPKRYEIWPDSVRLVFPLWGWDVRFETIESLRPSSWWEAYGFMGVRFATHPAQAIVVLRRNMNILTRPHLVISPADRDIFMRELEKAMRT